MSEQSVAGFCVFPLPSSCPRLACLFIPSFGDDSVERMMVNIARGIAGQGFPVDVMVALSRLGDDRGS